MVDIQRPNRASTLTDVARLTSIDMNLERLGAAAGRRLFAAIDGAAPPTSEQFPGRVVLRDSTAPAG